MATNLNENQLMAAAMLATGTKAVTVAQTLKITEETICRWRQLPPFRAAINQIHVEAMQAISDRLRHMGGVALEAIEDVLADPNTPHRERLVAAFKVLELMGGGALLRNIGPTAIEGIVADDRKTKMFAELNRSFFV